jgi:2-dehydro-3-deoxyphosphogluconate aldolase/(4S)-4-hydroxy-2-oxoglutarate aldolase
MDKTKVLDRVKESGLLAVIRGPSMELTVKTVDALIRGGVLGIEITFSTPDALKVVEQLRNKYQEKILLGVGTLTKIEQVSASKSAGAEFLVSPMLDEKLAKEMVGSGLVCMIGALTPSEVFHAYTLGSDVIKIFPGRLGGPAYIKDLRGPFPEIPFMPTGGVDTNNVREWFEAGVIAVGAGSNLCPKPMVLKEQFDEITKIAGNFVESVRKARQK